MKRFAAAALTAALALSMTSTAFAARGWQQDDNGNFRFYLNDNVFVTSGYTEDGYYVDVNGIWDGNPSIGTRQEDGSYEIIFNPFEGLDIRGDMILKSKGNPVLDENNMWHVKVDVLDTGFATPAELRQIQAAHPGHRVPAHLHRSGEFLHRPVYRQMPAVPAAGFRRSFSPRAGASSHRPQLVPQVHFVSSFSSRIAVALPSSPISPTGPTQEGQPCLQLQSCATCSAFSISISRMPKALWLSPMPPGQLS